MVVRRQRTRAPRSEEPVAVSRAARRLGRVEAPPQVELIAKLAPNNEIFSSVVQKASSQMQEQRPGHYLHVSDLLSKCIRKRALHHRLNLKARPRRLSIADRLTFAQGDAIHDLLKAIARDGRPDYLWGKWSCKCGYLRHEEPCTFAEVDQEEECSHCMTKVDTYHEVSMIDEELWVVGNPDVILYLPHMKAFHIAELKSISGDQFKELRRPKPEHVLQVVWYWFLMHRAGYRLTNKVSIFYASKAWTFNGKDCTREFLIDPQAELKRLDDMIEDAKAHKKAIQDKKAPLPLRSFCSSSSVKHAKDCELCETCFGLPA